MSQVPKPNNLREEDLDDNEEVKLAGLVSGNVGPMGATPKVVQDSRNWADGIVQNANESVVRRNTNFFSSNDMSSQVGASAHKSAPPLTD